MQAPPLSVPLGGPPSGVPLGGPLSGVPFGGPPSGVPFGGPVQVPVAALHVLGLTHWLELVQPVRQALSPQTKGLQDLDGP